MVTDSQLLRDYAETGSDQAFGTLVERHIDLVYSMARRLTGGDQLLTEDIAQLVFTDLARQARRLQGLAAVGAWLYRHTYFTACKAIRSERRRAAREKAAAEMNALNHDVEVENAWRQIAPGLDHAMNRLGARDRDALVLRYFQRQDLRAVGLALD